ncbi:hypothetical protein CEXT_810551 [Caerostris extrusa]|uniref:Uncharacterized protein n=1 Tax=Caerostris extrusa TaxID=172846 RepID=A0AAV4P1B4_CAEEX|nr:hypothetical protein CEXT_810551 [Caerostris extrusa]
MIETGIYKKVHAFDYQAVCLELDPTYGFSPYLLTLSYTYNLVFMNGGLKDWVLAANEIDYENIGNERPNKTVPHPCAKEIDLFEMLPRDFGEPVKGRLSMCHSSGCDKQFIVQQVPYTNLVMLVVYTTCPCETTSIKLEPKK